MNFALSFLQSPMLYSIDTAESIISSSCALLVVVWTEVFMVGVYPNGLKISFSIWAFM